MKVDFNEVDLDPPNLNISGEFEARIIDLDAAEILALLIPKRKLILTGMDNEIMETLRKLPTNSIIEFTYNVDGNEALGGHNFRIKRRDYRHGKVWLEEV